MVSIATDYLANSGSPRPYLEKIANAGFSHVHWCHHWAGDFIYSASEIDKIKEWLKEYGIKLLDLHASAGKEKYWMSKLEYERLAGIELLKNRIDMTSRLGGDAIVLHLVKGSDYECALFWENVRIALDTLRPFAKERNVKIALENLFYDGDKPNFDILELLFSEYPPEFLGLCYDAGHGNIVNIDGMKELDRLKDRLISLHLSDNDGAPGHDEHKPLFSGSIDWERLAGIIARSSYKKCINMELNMRQGNAGFEDDQEAEFLQMAYETGMKFQKMIDDKKMA